MGEQQLDGVRHAGGAAADSVLEQLRAEACSRLGVKFTRVEAYTMVRTSALARTA